LELAHWTTAARVLQQSWQSFKGLAAGHLQFAGRGLQAGVQWAAPPQLPRQDPGPLHFQSASILPETWNNPPLAQRYRGPRLVGLPCQFAFFQSRSWNRFSYLAVRFTNRDLTLANSFSFLHNPEVGGLVSAMSSSFIMVFSIKQYFDSAVQTNRAPSTSLGTPGLPQHHKLQT
jgi:hypothetical protein